ncbi:hypothetical protein U9M48_033169, partial [Paspalum notatum var. saurae]
MHLSTRSTKVAKMMALKIQQLGYMSDTSSWFICQDAALRGCELSPNIMDDIYGAKACRWLQMSHWEAVEKSDFWNSELVGQTLPALLVSYNSLQKHMKPGSSMVATSPQGFIEADKEHNAEQLKILRAIETWEDASLNAGFKWISQKRLS